ncbi:MAG: SHOCT domain-containing protein [Hydrogenophaga sp.]|uniref:SHOCT domain-containing protein n=1 Tax=Comamonadaceae TaxID=80864 RepID=UPI00272F6728|nr:MULTISPECIES: SHOCT domain-containing protein [Comamonadaceae]MDP2440455.1 SHOCT domain-containing protein [Rhodoferax sp.]MDZ4177081.1 SHOCT domain-containing protein [Hydrogenophaga sp.]
MRPLFFTILFTSSLIGACAKDSGVLLTKESKSLFASTICRSETSKLSEEKTSGESYRIYQQAATGFVPLSAVREDIEKQAISFCKNNNKQVKQLAITNSPMGLGCPAKAELIFTCTESNDADGFDDKLYIRLSNLKKLLESGALTKEEFEQQKAKLLNP